MASRMAGALLRCVVAFYWPRASRLTYRLGGA